MSFNDTSQNPDSKMMQFESLVTDGHFPGLMMGPGSLSIKRI